MNRLLAIMILIAVSMGIAAAFIGWFLSTYYIFTWRPEILRVLDIKMYYNETDGSWYLNMTLVNVGEAPAEIYKLEVYGVETVSFNPPIVVKPSEERELQVKLMREYKHGVMYTVKLYLKSGTLYPVLERAVKA
jgi:hypothetical protein